MFPIFLISVVRKLETSLSISGEETGDESMQLDSLFMEDYEADQPVIDEENPPRSDSNSNAAARADSEPRIDSHSVRQNEASVARLASQQSHQGDGGSKQKPRKCRNRKRYRPYAKNVTVSVIIKK